MKDETKHFIAKQIAFVYALTAFGWLIFLPLVIKILNPYHNGVFEQWFETLFLQHDDSAVGWLFAFIPLIIGINYKILRWVAKWY